MSASSTSTCSRCSTSSASAADAAVSTAARAALEVRRHDLPALLVVVDDEDRHALERAGLGARGAAPRDGAPTGDRFAHATIGRRTVNVAPRPSPALSRDDRAAVRLDELLDDRQAEPEAAVRASSSRPPGGTARTRTAGNLAGCPGRCRLTIISTTLPPCAAARGRRRPPA